MGQAFGPQECSGAYSWKLDKRGGGYPGSGGNDGSEDSHIFDVAANGDAVSFVHFFAHDQYQNGQLLQSMVISDNEEGFAGTIGFTVTGESPDGSIQHVSLTTMEGSIGSFSFLGFPTGETSVALAGNSSDLVGTYDVNAGVIELDHRVDVLLVNPLFPLGLEAEVEVRIVYHQGDWWATGTGHTFDGLNAKVDYDGESGLTKLVVENATPGGTVRLAIQGACLGDVDRNRVVNDADLLLIVAALDQSVPPGTPEDINQDGVVDDTDIDLVNASMGCSDGGSAPIAGCEGFVAIDAPYWVNLQADGTGRAVMSFSASGYPLSAYRYQAVDEATCNTSNMALFTIH